MPQLVRPACLFVLALLLGLGAVPGWAQVAEPGAEAPARPQPDSPARRGQPATARLTRALSRGQATRDAATADSLLVQARQLGHVPSQVVALSQLAAVRLREQDAAQAGELLREAEQLVGQLRSAGDVGWVLGLVGADRGRVANSSPVHQAQFAPLMKALTGSLAGLTAARVKVPEIKVPEVRVPEVRVSEGGSRGWDKSLFTDAPRGRRNVPPAAAEATVEARLAASRAQAAVEKLLDTLIIAKANPPQVVRRLTARRKLRDSSEALSKAYAQRGDYAQAYQYFLKYNAYKDSLTAEATTRRLAELEYRQNLLRKEAQIQRLNKERVLREQAARRQQLFVLALIGGIAVLGGFAGVLSRNNRLKQRANLRLQEQQAALERAIQDLRTTQAQLVQAEKMASLGELTAGIAHEIQNPLNFVNNFAAVSQELCQEAGALLALPARSAEDEAELRDLLADLGQNQGKIVHHGQRAAGIVRGMLEHSRQGTGERVATDLNALAEEYLRLAYHGLRAKDKSFNATLHTDFAPALPLLKLVGADVGRVLLNLFTNAFYAVQQRQKQGEAGYQPAVSVQTSQKDGQVLVRVSDNGTGIPEAVKAKIFQPFFTTKPTGEGTGLGLSLSYDIVTKGHGGSLAVESQEGQGTTFSIGLPSTRLAVEPAKPADGPASALRA